MLMHMDRYLFLPDNFCGFIKPLTKMEDRLSFNIEDDTDFPIYSSGEPSFSNLEKWEKESLIHPLLEVIKIFYENPINRQKYEKWLTAKTTGKVVLLM